jgi:hypothetical protein
VTGSSRAAVLELMGSVNRSLTSVPSRNMMGCWARAARVKAL